MRGSALTLAPIDSILSTPYPYGMLSIPNDREQTEDYVKILKENLKPVHAADPTVLKFISNYVHCRDLSQAAKETDITHIDARTLFNRPDIFKTIEKITQAAVVKYGYDASEVVERTKELAFFDPVDLVEDNGTYKKNLREVPAASRRAIKKLVVKNIFELDSNGVPQYRGEVITYEFWDKPRSLELLGREKDTFKKTLTVEHDVGKNAREFLLASSRMADQAVAEMRDAIPVQSRPQLPSAAGENITIPTIPSIPGIKR